MSIEIERKFLVIGQDWRTSKGVHICQGYLSRAKERTVRVRIAGDHAYLTVKGVSIGASRAEFEYEVPVADAEAMLKLCEGPVIRKVRHRVEHAGLTWEVDEFLGDNLGLVVAEVELKSESQPFETPPWVATEVTTDPRYFNSQLAEHPYMMWHESGNCARPDVDRYAPDDWTLDGPRIIDIAQLERVRVELASAPVLLKHWHYRGACCPSLLVLEEYTEFLKYLHERARPGDAFDLWSLHGFCNGLGTLAAGKYPDTDGAVPRRGAY